MSNKPLISVSSSDFSGKEREYLINCLDRNWISQGYYVDRFERLFAEVSSTKHAISCSSGTAALHLSLLSVGADSHSAVIVPSLTYVATANAAKYCGADVYFCDIDPDNWCLDTLKCETLAHDLSDRYKKVITIPVHLFDSICEDVIDLTAGVVIEDSCHLAPDWTNTLSVYSFYGSKIITCGEGGMIVTDDDDIAERIRLYRGQGAKGKGSYHHEVVGYNYRMTDLQAAIGLAQLERLDSILLKRRSVIDRYRENLKDCSITLQLGERGSAWMTAVLLPEGIDRDNIAHNLLDSGIETRPFFEPLHTLLPYRDLTAYCPIAESVSKRGICLPTHTMLGDQDIDYVCEKLRGIVV